MRGTIPVRRTGVTPPRAWQRMLSGRRLDLLNPSPFDVELSDIAHGLARVARWNGQTRGAHAFSVAQHALFVEALTAELAPRRGARVFQDPSEQLMALLHDAPEYVIGDLISPFKVAVGADYKRIEAQLLGAIYLRFGLSAAPPRALTRRIKRADAIAAFLEATTLAGFTEREARSIFGAPPAAIVSAPAVWRPWLEPLSTPAAQAAFTTRAEVLIAAVDAP